MPLKATIEGDKEQVSNRELPLILSCSFSLPPSFFLSLTRLTLTEGVSIIIWQIGVVDWGQGHRWDFMWVFVCVYVCVCVCVCYVSTCWTCAQLLHPLTVWVPAWVFIGYLTPFFPAKCWTFPPHGLDLFVFSSSQLCMFSSRPSYPFLPCCLPPPFLSNYPVPQAGLPHCQKLPEQKGYNWIIQKRLQKSMTLA